MGAALRDYLVKAQNFCFIPCGNVRPFLVQIRLGSPALRQKALRDAAHFGYLLGERHQQEFEECVMFIAMNRFKVKTGSEHDFQQVWLKRDSHLDRVPGFIEFHLLKGPEQDGYVLYASHTKWRSEADFLAWTQSEAFRKAHASAGGNKQLYLGHPEFEGFTSLQKVKAKGAETIAAE